MISNTLIRDVSAHALRDFPRESGGYILDGEIVGRDITGDYLPLLNTSDDPTRRFRADPEEYLKYEGRITAFVHSHPNGHAAPSSADMIAQASMAIPFVIVATNGSNCSRPFEFGDQLERFPLEGREFRHGVTDCYEAGRDWYYAQENRIELPSFPRDWMWWKNGGDLYRKNYEAAGFRLLEAGETPQFADAFFICLGSKGIPNHGGVYVGDGRIYHHQSSMIAGPYAPGFLSVTEYGMRWMDLKPQFLRHRSFDK